MVGLFQQGRVAFLTNVLELHTFPDAKSRASTLLSSVNHLSSSLLVVDIKPEQMDPKDIIIKKVSPGIHVLPNATLDSPEITSLDNILTRFPFLFQVYFLAVKIHLNLSSL